MQYALHKLCSELFYEWVVKRNATEAEERKDFFSQNTEIMQIARFKRGEKLFLLVSKRNYELWS